MQKDIIVQKLKEKGCRMTKQRKILIDVILENECCCCKEIHFKASKRDPKIGSATVYRMVNMLEEIGAIDRRNMYRVNCDSCEIGEEAGCVNVKLDDQRTIALPLERLDEILAAGLRMYGYMDSQRVVGLEIS
ncbi:MAG: transcriptional repressor [Lachnospiraceae bacterium]|nr:transcriptional repressor [Lachnospiraceae bacterium]